MIFCPKSMSRVSSCYFCGYFVTSHDLTPKGTSTSKDQMKLGNLLGLVKYETICSDFLGVVFSEYRSDQWLISFRIPWWFMRDELPWGGTIAARWKRKSQCHKKLGIGGFVDIFLADSDTYYPLFFQGFQSLNKQMLWDDGSRIFFSYTQIFGFVFFYVPTRNSRTDCCHPAVAADLGGSLWVTWQKGFGIPVPFRIETCTICEAGAHSIWEVLAR